MPDRAAPEHVAVAQGTPLWRELRRGVPTASGLDRIITPGGKPSSQQAAYQGQLLAAWALGVDAPGLPDELVSELAPVVRGVSLEDEARGAWELAHDAVVTPGGWWTRAGVGCSPDGQVGREGLLELKCPLPATHLVWLAAGTLPRPHLLQLQGQLWVTGRAWVAFSSYCPGLPGLDLRVGPDARLQERLDELLPAFVAELAAARRRLEAAGVVPVPVPRPMRGELARLRPGRDVTLPPTGGEGGQ